MENRKAWEEGPGGIGKGARSGVIWSPLVCSIQTITRLIDEAFLLKEDIEFILSMFQFRDQFIAKYAPDSSQFHRSLFLYSDTWDLRRVITDSGEWGEDSTLYRVYIVVPLIHSFSLIILSPKSKTYQIVFAAESVESRIVFKQFSNMLFGENLKTGGVLGRDWNEGFIGNEHLNWLKTVNSIVEKKELQAVFIIYVIYYLCMEAPVYFRLDGDCGKTLRENIAYYCLKGNLPY